MTPEQISLSFPKETARRLGVVPFGEVEIPNLKASTLEEAGVPSFIAGPVAGTEQLVAGILDFATSAPGILTLMSGGVVGAKYAPAAIKKFGGRAIAGAFAADMARHAPDTMADLVQAIATGNTETVTKSIGNAALAIGLAKKATGIKQEPSLRATRAELIDQANMDRLLAERRAIAGGVQIQEPARTISPAPPGIFNSDGTRIGIPVSSSAGVPKIGPMEAAPSGLEIKVAPRTPEARGGIVANQAMLDLLPEPTPEILSINELLRKPVERGEALRQVEELGQKIRRQQDFERARAEQLSQNMADYEASLLHPDKPLTDNQIKIVEDSLKKAILENQIPGERKGVISGSRLEEWADKVLSTDPRKRVSINPIGSIGESLAATIVKGAALLERGAMNFAEWSKAMVNEYGKDIEPFLKKVYVQSIHLSSKKEKPSSIPAPVAEAAKPAITKEFVEEKFAGRGMKDGVGAVIAEHQGNVPKLEELLKKAQDESNRVKTETAPKLEVAKASKDMDAFSAVQAERQKAAGQVQIAEEAIKYSKELEQASKPAEAAPVAETPKTAEQARPIAKAADEQYGILVFEVPGVRPGTVSHVSAKTARARGFEPEAVPAKSSVPPEPTPAPPEPRSPQVLGITPEGTGVVQAVIDWVRDVPTKARVVVSQLAGKAAPLTSTASEASGNAIVKYASSNIAAPLIGRSMATEVLGPRYRDAEFSNRLGAVLVEDRLRAIKDGFARAGDDAGAAAVETAIGKEWSPLKTEADFQAALKDPDIVAAIDRHKATVQETAKLQHEETGGQLAGPGLNTGAFVNLKAIFPDAPEVPFGQGGRGNLENPLKRPSKFGKQARGTAEKYETDYRTLSERMVSGNYAEYTKRQMYDQLVKDGLAVFGDAGQKAPTIGGKKTVKFTIERYNAPSRNIWVREDIAPELRQALNVDGAVSRAGLTAAANLINRIQLAGPTDAVWHTANMLSSIAGSQGGRTVLADLARKLPGVNIADAVTRVVASSIRVLRDTPEIQKQLAGLSEIGAMRAKPVSGNALLDFNHRVIALVDRAGRLVRDDLYQNLVRRGLVTSSEAGRREWVNQMGNYNGRLMGQFQRFFKEAGFSPFIVAGRNFNRMAMRRLAGSPGIKAANTAAALEMRAIEWLGTAATLFAIPSVINYFTTGSPSGRSGVKMGQVDTGKDREDGSHLVIDPAQWTGLRRGLRISGVGAIAEGIRRGGTGKEISQAALRDVLGGIVHPWAGPAVSAVSVATTGKSPTGYRESHNPYDYEENIKAALKQLNPVVESIFKAHEKKGGGAFPKTWKEAGIKTLAQAEELGMSLGGAAGIKGVRPLTASRQIMDKANDFMEAKGLKAKGVRFEFTDDPSYRTLRRAVSENSKEKIRDILTELQKTKKLNDIIKAQKQYSDRPFTGSEKQEKEFLRSLSEKDRDLYWQAREQRKQELGRFFQMLP
jgi:hypothetical protein